MTQVRMIGYRPDAETFDKLEAEARKEGRSLANMVDRIISKYFTSKEIIKKEPYAE
jgi:hypothetical protein